MFKRGHYRKRAALGACVLLLLASLLAGCGGARDQAVEDMDASAGYGYSEDGGEPGLGLVSEEMEYQQKTADTAASPEGGSGSSDRFRRYGDNVKLVYTAQLNLQTTDYEKAEGDLTSLVESMGGYFEYTHVDRGGYYSDGTRIYGNYTVRIPADKYESFLASVGETCHVVSLDRSVSDIGMDYFDTETRLNTLRTKMERLTELLERAEAMSDIIELENSIANTQYEIDWHTSTLNRYDSLVGYSTVNISLEQVARLSGGVDDQEGFFPSLLRSLKEGLGHFADSIETVALWIAYNLVSLAILAVLLLLSVKWYRKRMPGRQLSLPGWMQSRKQRTMSEARKDGDQQGKEQ